MKLAIQPVTAGRTAKLQVDKIDPSNGGNVVARATYAFIDPKDLKQAARILAVKYDLLFDFIINKYPAGQTELELKPARLGDVFKVRPERGKVIAEYPDFNAAIDATPEDHVIEWATTETTCCLDADWHGTKTPPNAADLRNFCEAVRPAPFAFWISRGGGVHLMYHAAGEYNADDVAAVAAYALLLRFPEAGIELLHRTRRNPPGNPVHRRVAENDLGCVRRLLGEYAEDEYGEWLADKGYAVGGRYPHTLCPVDPRPASEGNTDPVTVHEDHIFCYHCASKGTTRGSATPGYFPLAALAGERTETLIGSAVANMVHWHDQAAHYMGSKLANLDVGRRIYRALLLSRHPGNPLVADVFTACRDNGLMRCDGYWTDRAGTPLPLDAGSAILKSLPHCQAYDKATGDIIDLAENREWFSIANCDQSARGYVPLHPLRGIQLSQMQEKSNVGRVFVVRHAKELAQPANADRRPRYIHDKDRLPWAECVATLAATLPGVDCTLLELLVVGRGCVETRAGLPPMLFVTGPTGAGKTAHAKLAAAICGDAFTAVPYTKHGDRLRQGLMAAKQAGAFVMFDEVFKNARSEGVEPVVAMEALLSFTPESVSHALYIGQLRMGDLPFMMWADNRMPLAVMQHEQIGRRVHHYSLHSSVDWEGPLRTAGIIQPDSFRVGATPELLHVANSFLSHIMDRHFPSGSDPTDFATVAASLGVAKLRDGEAVQAKHELIRELFAAVCAAPPAPATLKKPRGVVEVLADPSHAVYPHLAACWAEDEHMQPVCKMIDEADVRKVCGLAHPATFEVKKHGAKFYVRFKNERGTLVNGELLGVRGAADVSSVSVLPTPGNDGASPANPFL